MKVDGNGGLQLSATDLSNHIACGHLTTLSLAYARKEIGAYTNFDPLLKILQERGRVHEEAYTQHLRASGKRVESGGNQTFALMAQGFDVITQATLERGPWFGRADFLVRVDRPCAHWAWSYEVIDTKLSSETRAGAVLQLCVYSDLLGTLQGSDPEAMHVVKPGPDFPTDSFRFDEYSAIYRALRGDLEKRLSAELGTYPEPTAHCESCNWRDRCDQQRRADDHLTFVADLGRTHQRELDRHGIRTLTSLAGVPAPWPHKPERGSAETYQRLAQQARLQLAAKGNAVPPFELLPIEAERGLSRLPAPSDGDIFLDFEGDPFIGDAGREYLFGFYTHDRGFEVLWALDDTSERDALDRFIAFVMARWEVHPGMHIYHFAPYEPTALKRLVGRYGIRIQELDRLLRGERLVDLYSITRQAARIGVESYSIKYLESLIGYQRPVPLEITGPGVRALKLCLQRGFPSAIEPAWRTNVEDYNRGDCESTLALRDWLEVQRAAAGIAARPALHDGHPEKEDAVRTEAAATAARLLDGVSPDRTQRDDTHEARWLLGHLQEWYRREASVTWREYFERLKTTDEERLDDLRAIAGLEHVSRTERGKKLPIDRYRFPAQDLFIKQGDLLIALDERKLGTVVAIDPALCTVDIRKTKDCLDEHPTSAFTHKVFAPMAKAEALLALGKAVVERGFDAPSLAGDLLFRHPPRGLGAPGASLRRDGEAIGPCALRLALALSGTVLPIQGPPGTGKTSTAADMILALIRAGRRVGVTATSHAVIENLVQRVVEVGVARGQTVRAALKCDDDDDTQHTAIQYIESATEADDLVAELQLLGATPWQWAREQMRRSVDVLFIDEAGQMSLADAIAVCEATTNLVLVGDPQQLEQPIQGTHPDGVAVSVLQHLLGEAQTLAPDHGLLLDQTHRLHPTICTFTSEQFYERKLSPGPKVATQAVAAGPLTEPGRYWMPVAHAGNQNRSREEAAAVAELVARCLGRGATWTNADGESRDMTTKDILIVAPYNAHVAAVRDALAARGLGDVRVGTVDKFQGREAAIAIYTMATSVPEDAPRGLGFLYDRHRLNVATSRAMCAAVLVCSPALLRPTCSTPTHLHLASALARFVEGAATLTPPSPPAGPAGSGPRSTQGSDMTVKSTGELTEGVYEHLVTEQLERALAKAGTLARVLEAVDDGEAHVVLARHLGRELERAFDSLPAEQRAERVRALTSKLLDVLADELKADAAEDLREQRPVAPARRLLAIHRGGVPPRPTTPLAMSTLLSSRKDPSFGHELAREAASADRIDAIIAFVTVGGVRTILDSLQQFSRRDGAQLRLLTTTFTGTTQVAALDTLARLPGAQIKVSYDTRRTRLHAKAWLFHRATGLSTAYVGSANLTATALGAGHEWMVKISNADLNHVIDKFGGTFETLWADPEFEAFDPDDPTQRARLAAALSAETSSPDERDRFLVRLQALPFQQEILDKLVVERTIHNRHRNLVVAATGTGKTVIAALDYARSAQRAGVPPRLLFLAHRAELLEQARRTFRYALQDASFGELLLGGDEPTRWDHVFASIQSAASTKLLERFGPSYFHHVVVDECHHVPARSYQELVPHLTPDILVGLTATPERADNQSLLPDFGGHVAAELRLWSALDNQLLVPFEYYGISDGTNLRDVRWTRTGYDAAALADLYTGNDRRAELIRHQLAVRVADPRAIRALGFCVSVEHAKFMAARFSAAGIPSLAVYADSPERDRAPDLLRERAVNVLFTCDLYNEGVDLPFVDTLLLLRPTQSATLFLQQLGRGLRLHPDKTSCLVLDFIGQHRDEFRFDQTLPAITGVPRPALKKAIEDGFPFLPSGCSLQLDHVARTQILASLRSSLAGARRLAAELRELSAHQPAPSLAQFLETTGRDLDDIYDAGGWTTLKRHAGLLAESPDADEIDELSRRLGMLQHIDEPARLRSYRDILHATARNDPRPLSDLERRRMTMLESQLHHRGTLRAAEQTATYLATKPVIVQELDELREVLEDRVTLPAQILPVPEWPLALHRHYSRREIAVGVGYVAAGDKSLNLQTGILKLKDTKQELLFVTLDKSSKDFSPTTRYRDFAISADRFHWETQAGASVSRPSGRRYVDPNNGWRFYLFVRTDPESAFCFLGPVRYTRHEGDRPIAITWELETPMPASLAQRYETLRPA